MDSILLQYEDLNKIIENPFLAIKSRYLIVDFFAEEIDFFEKILRSFKEKENISHFKLLFEMIRFAKIYELFRPKKITKNDFYFGTVKKMDAIYFTLFKFIDSELLFSFSHSITDMEVEYRNLKKQNHDEIYWDEILEDIQDIGNAIKREAEEKALELYFLLGSETPYFVIKIIEEFILKINDKLTKDDISFDHKDGYFVICNKKINAQNYYSFFEQIQKLVK
ncbi:MAG: hypothetical protein LBC77_01275 [Spirochaetaceae bacterium]|jgi:hypothetical protein|nr:hypothetical protein [Spirochaetaceae bacterium]